MRHGEIARWPQVPQKCPLAPASHLNGRAPLPAYHPPTLPPASRLQLNLDVIEATNGREGLLAYLAHGRDRIAFVFLDLMMPVWDGFRAALSIRRCARATGRLVALRCAGAAAGRLAGAAIGGAAGSAAQAVCASTPYPLALGVALPHHASSRAPPPLQRREPARVAAGPHRGVY